MDSQKIGFNPSSKEIKSINVNKDVYLNPDKLSESVPSMLNIHEIENEKKKSTILTLSKKCKMLKNNYIKLSQENNEVRAQNESLKAQILEYQYQISQLNLNLHKYAEDSYGDRKTDNENIFSQKENEFMETSRQFEILFQQQSQEISNLASERSKLISLFQNLDLALSESIQRTEYFESESKQLTNQIDHITITSEMNQNETKLIQNSLNEILELSPLALFDEINTIKHSFLSEQSMNSHDLIKHLAKVFINHIEFYQNQDKFHKENLQKQESIINTLKKQNIALINHLRNAQKFIKENIYIYKISDSNERNELLKECTILGRFIDDQKSLLNISSPEFSILPSLFHPIELNDPQKIMHIILDFVPEEKMNEHPYPELFTLLTIIIQSSCSIIHHYDQISNSNMTSKPDSSHSITSKNSLTSQNSITSKNSLTSQNSTSSNNSMPSKKSVQSKKSNHEIQSDDRVQQIINELYSFFISNIILESDSSISSENEATEYEEDKIDMNNDSSIDQFIKIAKKFMKQFENLERSQEDNTQLVSQINYLKKQIQDTNEEHNSAKMIFCEKANSMINQLQQAIKKEEIDQKKQKQALLQQLKHLKTKLNDLMEHSQKDKMKFKKKMKMKKQTIIKLQNDLLNKTANIESLNSQILELKKEYQIEQETHKSDLKKYQDEIEKYIKTIQKLQNSKTKLKNLLSGKSTSNTLLEQVQNQNEKLSSKYDNHISTLENQLKIAQDELQKSKEQLENITTAKQQLVEQNARLKITERSLTMKLKAANEQINAEKQSAELQKMSISTALRSQYEIHLNEIHQKLSKCMTVISSQLEHVYGVKLSPNSSAEVLAATLQCEIDNYLKSNINVTNDYIKSKKLMLVPKDSSLFDEITKKEAIIAELRSQIACLKENETEASIQKNALKSEKKDLEMSHKEIDQWYKWSISLYNHISETVFNGTTGDEIRKGLEVLLISSIDQRSLTRKLDILRKEKKMLKGPRARLISDSNNDLSNKISQSQLNSHSIRPIILVLIFSKRLQNLSGTVAIVSSSS